MTRITLPEDDARAQPSRGLNAFCFVLPVLSPLLQFAVLQLVVGFGGILVLFLFLGAQYVAGAVLAIIVAATAPTPRRRAAANSFALGSVLVPVILYVLLMAFLSLYQLFNR